MLILITYDVAMTDQGNRRLRRIAKICTNYGQRVQNSVFECVLNQTQFTMVKHQLENIMDKEQDNIRFYFMGSNWQRKIIQLGIDKSYDPTAELII